MAQVKKPIFASRILESAEILFGKANYHEISMSQIGRQAGVTPANIYTYFESKFELIKILFARMIETQLPEIEEQASQIANPRERIVFVLRYFWIDCINAHGPLSRNFLQALALADQNDEHSEHKDELLDFAVQKLGKAMALEKLDPLNGRKYEDAILLLVVMAFDGFAINSARRFPPSKIESTIERFTDLILGAIRPLPQGVGAELE